MSNKARKKFEEYIALYKQGFCFAPKHSVKFPRDSTGVTAFEAFNLWESFGKIVTTNDPETLEQALMGKESINFHIQMWSEDLVVPLQELFEEFKFPEWIKKTLQKEVRKKFELKLREV